MVGSVLEATTRCEYYPKKFAALVSTDENLRHRNANWRTGRLNHALQTHIFHECWRILGESLSKDRNENLESVCPLLYSLDGGPFMGGHHRKNLLPILITL